MTDVRVGEGEGDGEVRGEGKGPTPMVSGIVGSLDFYIQACKHNGIQIFSTLGFKPNVSTINYYESGSGSAEEKSGSASDLISK